MAEIKKVSINLSQDSSVVRNDDSEKFLFIDSKSIGFRKDKKLHKFVGLRDGYNNQFEISLDSIKLDGVDYISKNMQYFTNISGDKNIIHNIDNMEIISDVSNGRFQNLIKIEDDFRNAYIVYELHLNDFTYNHDIDNNSFDILDVNGNVLFIIQEPIVYDSVNEPITGLIDHEIYEKDGRVYYRKFIINNYDDNKYPLLVDINVIYDVSSYGVVRSSNTLSYTSNTRTERWQSVLNAEYNVSRILNTDNMTYNVSNVNYCNNDRYFILFDTSSISQYDEIITAELTINVSGYNNPLVVHKGTVNNLSSIGWDTFNETILDNLIIEGNGTYKIDVRNLINKENHTPYYIRLYEYDNLGGVPVDNQGVNIFNHLSFDLDIYYKTLTEDKTFYFEISGNGTGVISSTSSDYITCLEGGGTLVVEHNVPTTSYGTAVGFSNIGGFNIKRTFFSLDTSQLSPYITDDVSNVILRLKTYNNHGLNDLTLVRGTQSGESPIGTFNWNDISNKIIDITTTQSSDEFLISIDRGYINFQGISTFGLISTTYDYEAGGNDLGYDEDVYIGVEFADIYVEIDIKSHKVYGQTLKKVEYDTEFTLTTYSNISSGKIDWFDDIYLTNKIGSGYTLTLDSKVQYDNEKTHIYSILTDSANNRVSNNVLPIELDIFNYEYDGLGIKVNNVIPMSLDTTYFKNYSCIDGVCYSYARMLDEVYEENVYVSDGSQNGSYNLYTEYDIIDEFYINTYNVDVAISYNIDINKLYKKLDGIPLVNGSRILLHGQTDIEENAIYNVSNNGKITNSNELVLNTDIFRSKINVNAGQNIDTEYHVMGDEDYMKYENSTIDYVIIDVNNTVELEPENPTLSVKYIGAEDTTMTIIIDGVSILVGNISGEFAWDIGGDNYTRFKNKGESYIYNINGVNYMVLFNGFGSLLYTVLKTDIPVIYEDDDDLDENDIFVFGHIYGYGGSYGSYGSYGNLLGIGENNLDISSVNPDDWMYVGLGLHNLRGDTQVFYEFNEPLGMNALYNTGGANIIVDSETVPNEDTNGEVETWMYIPIGIGNL